MIKYIIWGAGRRGQVLKELLGEGRIEAYVDVNPEIQNSRVGIIPVISPEVFFQSYKEYPVIITPQYQEANIKETLEKEDNIVSFLYEENINHIEAITRQVPMEQLFRRYDETQNIGIYGCSLLGILVYEYFHQKGLFVMLIPDESDSDKIVEFLKRNRVRVGEAKELPDIKKVLITKEIKTNDRLYGMKSKKDIEDYSNLGQQEGLYYYPQLEKFRGTHKNERCFIIATGPSLQVKDLEILMEHHEICIGMNGLYRIFGKTPWRPQYYITADAMTALEFQDELFQYNMEAIFISDIAWESIRGGKPDHVYRWHLHKYYQSDWDDEKWPEFSDDFARCSYCGKTVTYDALQLAVYMGFNEIYLLGTDFTSGKSQISQEYGHFYADKGTPSIFNGKEVTWSYLSAKKFADTHDVKIYNATRGGFLEVFPRVDFDKLFEED